ncbi:IS110 family transposase [Ktedonobacter racemifer]|uniref:Transposase IS111A/IS1328/IS1533 n=1 Tax=Ktedonobacter racemifer DSM 44963 TaxID=485913 RepID=D6TH15_KTERA|nr:IS110 family transposase [Ktedonobacter racemifer]EFH88944.1 transposase IS111A/IS1328/IS1533 [Ktedonobacter racemifer DSM 44963]
MWFAGIDWADTHHDILVLDERGQKLASFRIMHTSKGLDELASRLTAICGPEHKAELACIVETTRGLLITHLLEAGFAVYPVNPKTVDRKRSASGAKTDQIDAYLLAKHGRSEIADLRRLEPDSPLIAELKALTLDQDGLIQMQTRLVNQLTACLKAYYPVALTLFTKVQQPSTLHFLLAYPTPQEAMNASCEEIAELLRSTGYPTPKKTAASIVYQVHQPQLTADDVTCRTKSRLLIALIRQLQPVMEEIAAYDQEIERLFLMHADSHLFRMLPRAGKRIAPRLLAEIGDDRSRYQDTASLQALAGTSPVPYESGKYAKPHRRYACIKPLRNVLQQFAWQSIQTEAWASEYYERKRREGKSHTVAVRALANVWVRILFALWLKGEHYQSAIFEQARHMHAPRAA